MHSDASGCVRVRLEIFKKIDPKRSENGPDWSETVQKKGWVQVFEGSCLSSSQLKFSDSPLHVDVDIALSFLLRGETTMSFLLFRGDDN